MKENSSKEYLEMKPWQQKLHEVIFGYETFAGRLFDVVLLIVIILSVLAVMLESVTTIAVDYGRQLRTIEWVFTILFAFEYVGRIVSSPRKWKYTLSFMGIVDLLAILPTFISIFVAGAQTLLIIRFIRLVRVFRILKLSRYMRGATMLRQALIDSKHKIIVFFGSVIIIVVVVGTLMYLVEHGQNGFSSIPRSIYWAIVTITTVGYGDIAPVTVLGQTIASFLMIVGYAIIAVPTGIVTSQMMQAQDKIKKEECPKCKTKRIIEDASFCHNCGTKF
jgi:voltage-gated potassium channel